MRKHTERKSPFTPPGRAGDVQLLAALNDCLTSEDHDLLMAILRDNLPLEVAARQFDLDLDEAKDRYYRGLSRLSDHLENLTENGPG